MYNTPWRAVRGLKAVNGIFKYTVRPEKHSLEAKNSDLRMARHVSVIMNPISEYNL